jgi:hypothetical protein
MVGTLAKGAVRVTVQSAVERYPSRKVEGPCIPNGVRSYNNANLDLHYQLSNLRARSVPDGVLAMPVRLGIPKEEGVR